LGEKEELSFEEFLLVMAAYKKDIEQAQLEVSTLKLKLTIVGKFFVIVLYTNQ
jgi:hypothetical protein